MIPDILNRPQHTATLPTWLAPIERTIGAVEKKQLGEVLRSWMTVWEHHKGADEQALKKLMILELRGKRRALVLNRLKHWHDEARDRRERQEFPEGLRRA